jgi:hypothetical protein
VRQAEWICGGITMDQGFEGPPTEAGSDWREHAIESEQTDEHGAGLSLGLQSLIIRRTARSDFICGVTLAGAVLMAMALVVWQRLQAFPPPPPAVVSPALVVIPPVSIADPEEGPPVRVRNPFDATEVFDFPAGTSEADAREMTAQLLLQRARDRRGQELQQSLTVNARQVRAARE